MRDRRTGSIASLHERSLLACRPPPLLPNPPHNPSRHPHPPPTPTTPANPRNPSTPPARQVLSDILGSEDALGDMDFKVAGDAAGVTAFQARGGALHAALSEGEGEGGGAHAFAANA